MQGRTASNAIRMSEDELTDPVPTSTAPAQVELTELLSSVDLSAPSTNKFEAVKSWIARRAKLESRQIGVYWVSKPGNFDVRFNQPGVVRDRPLLGIALVPGERGTDVFKGLARRFVENSTFEVIVVCALSEGRWIAESSFAKDAASIDATGGGLVRDDQVVRVGDVPEDEDDPLLLVGEREREGGEARRPAGLDTTTHHSIGWDEYPLDSVFVRSETRTVAEVVKRIKAGRYKLDPEFQRDFVWPAQKQSRLIESCAMRIPLPVLYLAESKDGSIVVVDGLQRLTTFSRFLSDELVLSGLEGPEPGQKHSLSGLRFSNLPVALAERVEDTQLTLYILDAKAPERAKLDIFERVNSGVPLSRQQMRNCLFSGPATRWLKTAATEPSFFDATGRSLDAKTMRDREAINRFCAFRELGRDAYVGGDMDEFLAVCLEAMNDRDEADLDDLMSAFRSSMKVNHAIFGRHAFRRSMASTEEDASRTILNMALFDVCSVLFSGSNPSRACDAAADIRSGMRDLLADPKFTNAIAYSTNSTRQVQTRFEMAEERLRGLI